jgi:phosphoadenosine phosphosulfate reductase
MLPNFAYLADQLPNEVEQADPIRLISWGFAEFGNAVSLACSFGAEDVVLIDMVLKVNPEARIFVLDTGRLHQETYDVLDRCRVKYGIEFEVFNPDTVLLQELLRSKGTNSFRTSIENRKECCGIRKVEPLRRALAGQKAWITGLRREQAVTRLSLAKVENDEVHGGILKLNPLADWTESQVWDYIRANDLPYNALHDQGFPSIGCAPCTRAVQPGEDIRAGRWWWEDPTNKECGLHVKK